MSSDPVRLDLAGDAPERAVEALRFARGDAPGAARLAAIEAAVLLKIAPPTGGGGGSGGSSMAPVAKAGAVAIAAGAAVVAVVLATRSQPPPAVAHQTAETASASAPAASTRISPSPELPTFSVDDLPAAPEPTAVGPKPAGVIASASAALDPAVSERAEVALLDRAQASLPTRPADTLATCDEHARRFATGTLAQEREVLAIDALLRIGRRDEAEARAARFRQAFPRSGHLRRIEALLAR